MSGAIPGKEGPKAPAGALNNNQSNQNRPLPPLDAKAQEVARQRQEKQKEPEEPKRRKLSEREISKMNEGQLADLIDSGNLSAEELANILDRSEALADQFDEEKKNQ